MGIHGKWPCLDVALVVQVHTAANMNGCVGCCLLSVCKQPLGRTSCIYRHSSRASDISVAMPPAVALQKSQSGICRSSNAWCVSGVVSGNSLRAYKCRLCRQMAHLQLASAGRMVVVVLHPTCCSATDWLLADLCMSQYWRGLPLPLPLPKKPWACSCAAWACCLLAMRQGSAMP